MVIKFTESGHPVFRATSPLSRGVLKSKGGAKLSIRFCADEGYDWNCFSHNYFCLSVECLRSSLRFVWRIESLPCKNWETFTWGQSDALFVPKSSSMKTPTFSKIDPAQDLMQKVPRTSGKALTTKSGDEVMQWCRIHDNGWSRTVLHDKRYPFTESVACRECTLPKRWKIIQPKKLDSREHQHWAGIGSHNQQRAR